MHYVDVLFVWPLSRLVAAPSLSQSVYEAFWSHVDVSEPQADKIILTLTCLLPILLTQSANE